MGRESFSCVGYGYTELEARSNAEENDRVENGHQDGYSGTIGSATELHSKCIRQPKPAKKCQIERRPSGPRKWETNFVAKPSLSSSPRPQESFTKQGDALKAAKRLALQYGTVYVVEIEKNLVQGIRTPIRVVPEAGTTGQWRFWGEARS